MLTIWFLAGTLLIAFAWGCGFAYSQTLYRTELRRDRKVFALL